MEFYNLFYFYYSKIGYPRCFKQIPDIKSFCSMTKFMKIFISWSGNLSFEIANILDDWLQNVSPFITTYLSANSLNIGERWTWNLSKELNETDLGIICVTAENINSSWINFEAGALSKDINNSKVIPLLINISNEDLKSSPLSQFQTTHLNKVGVKRLVLSLYEKFNTNTPKERTYQIFEKWWPDLEIRIQKLNLARQEKNTDDYNKVLKDFNDIQQRFNTQLFQMNEVLENITTQIGIDQARSKVELAKFEGSWRGNVGKTQYYFKIINGQLFIPYLYHGNHNNKSHYYNIKLIENILYGRFNWFNQKISGYMYLKILDDTHLQGGWWYAKAVKPDVNVEELSDKVPNMNYMSLYKEEPQEKEPKWAKEYEKEKFYLKYQF